MTGTKNETIIIYIPIGLIELLYKWRKRIFFNGEDDDFQQMKEDGI